ncbi:ABC transporter ATP-binding protein [Georgenia sp. Z1491]|uniref:ABC transporter ATP-binding protein n=1 Tax=Georgenia sp. Z1491 TaxID=3416707 RepID=UPI003CF45594
MTSATTTAVELRDVRFTYRGAPEETLRGVDLEVEAGEFVAVMGASGAGKSTICQTLNGIVPRLAKGSFQGTVMVGGVLVSDRRIAEMAEVVGLGFQDFEAQLFSTNAELEVAFGLENMRMPREEIRERVATVLEQVGLTGYNDRQPATLSGGQKQRLAIASILAAQPTVVCLDEPTTDLDPVGKNEVFAIARRLAHSGVTLIVVEHETTEALMSDRIALVDQGRVVRIGAKEEILREAELFEELRIMPLQVPQLFARLGVETRQRPLTVEEGVDRYRSDGLELDVDAHRALLAADADRAASYGEDVIVLDNLSHKYPTGLTAVDGATLSIRQGEFVALLGQNGSGKTTLVKHLNGLLQPTTGRISVNGKDVREHSLLSIGSHVAYVFQNPDHQIFSDTVFDEVSFALRKRHMDDDEIKVRVAEVLEAVGMSGQEEEDPFSLTKGQRQRVAVASALALRPEVLILDEPTTGLDYHEQRSMMELVRRLNEEMGATIVVVTHAMWVVCEYAHRVVVMKNGSVVSDGTTREVFAQEEQLEGMALVPPPVVSLSNELGHTVLSVDEMLQITGGGAR